MKYSGLMFQPYKMEAAWSLETGEHEQILCGLNKRSMYRILTKIYFLKMEHKLYCILSALIRVVIF